MPKTPEKPSLTGPDGAARRPWTFLTNHGHVLVCIAQNPDIRIADIADRVGIGERAAHKIVQDLVADGYVARTHVGRRNTYKVDFTRSFRHPLEANHAIGEVFRVLSEQR
jgi:DNA-binding IclR family transcriptional regulator